MAEALPMVAVVGPQFCVPYVVALTVTKKALSWSDGDFVVTDVNGAVSMKVSNLLSITNSLLIPSIPTYPISYFNSIPLDSIGFHWIGYILVAELS